MIRKQEWLEHLYKIYGREEAEWLADSMEKRFEKYGHKGEEKQKENWLSEKDTILITYGDSLVKEGEAGLCTLRNFMERYVKGAIHAIHLLPIFPYTSDDGFSVVDFKEIHPSLGDWGDIRALARGYSLMFDAVVNHISQSSEWFQKFLKCEAPYRDYFITADPGADYSQVTRPRALPLLTSFETAEGEKYVWTTFSEDQVDLNYACPDVLLEVMDVLLTYGEQGARFIRLDAIGFLWKTPGTSCMHLPQTHEIIKLMRKVLEDYMPGTLLITETNVPYRENISYFGNGDEAHLIYQFPLPPLTMFSLLTGDASKLSSWAKGLDVPEKGTAYFNFLSSHDGIGIRPTEGILTKEEQQFLVEATLKNGGVVSYKNNGDGTKSPYELNINYQDALASPDEKDSIRLARFLAAETILLSLQGLPGIYIHSLLGSRNDYYGKEISGIPRRINREKLSVEKLERDLSGDTNRSYIFHELHARLEIRKQHKAFSPDATQKIRILDSRVFALEREAEDTGEKIEILINVSGERVALSPQHFQGKNLLAIEPEENKKALHPYEACWILKSGNVR